MTNNRQVQAVLLGMLVFVGSVPFSMADVSDAVYDVIQSPKKQLESGVMPEDVICRDDIVLALRASGSPVCISEKTAEKKGWEIIEQSKMFVEQKSNVTSQQLKIETTTKAEPQLQTISDKTLTVIQKTSESKINSIQTGPCVEFMTHIWPKMMLQSPKQVRVGETFDLTVDYTWIDPDNGFGNTSNYEDYEDRVESDEFYTCFANFVDANPETNNWERTKVTSFNIHTLRTAIVQDESFSVGSYTETNYEPTFDRFKYTNVLPFENTINQQVIVPIQITEPNNIYEKTGYIEVEIGPRSGAVINYAIDNGIVTLYDEDSTILGAITASMPERKYVADILNYTGDFKLVHKPQNLDNIPIEEFADFLLEYYPDENYREFLSIWNATDSFIEKLFTQRPDLEKQSINHVLHWILP